MAQLVLYGSNVADATLTTACDMSGASGGVETFLTTTVSGASAFAEVLSQGGTSNTVASLPTPTGNGWIYYPGAGTFAADNWSASITLSSLFTGTDLRVRFYSYSAGGYTSIGSILVTFAGGAKTTYSFAATAMPSVTTGAADGIYVDLWWNDSGGAGGDNPVVYESTSSTAGVASDMQITTSNFTPGITLYGSSVADATLTTACDMASTSGGAETSKTTTHPGGSGNFAEVTSQGGTFNAVAALPAPTGKGWVYQPGAGTFDLGNWSASVALSTNVSVSPATWVMRFYQYIGGSYTSIGTISSASLTTVVTRTVTSFIAASMPSTTFAATDLLYIDLWFTDTTGANGISPVVYVSTTSTAGVTNDMQVKTANFVPTVVVPVTSLVKPYVHYSIPRALGGTIIPLVIKPPVIYEPRALGSTLLTDARIFIPRALGGTYIQDDPTLLWVPHALGGTTQVPTSVALTSTIHAIGLESTTLSLATALADTIPAIGALTPTLTASVALSSTLAAIGVLTPSAFTESTALADTIPAVGTLSGTLLASLALSTTIPAVGTLTGTFTESTALTVTIPAVGTLTGTLSTSSNVSLAVTIPAIGTITGTLGLATSLSSTVAAVGTLNGTLTVGNPVSLAVTIPAVGTLTASPPGLKTALTLSIAALGTISPGATFSEALSGTTLVAMGILSGSVSLSVILGATLPGLGTISATYQVRTALSLQLMAVGALLGTIRVPATFFGPYSATESTLNKLTSRHTVTSKSSQHVSSTYTAVRK